MGTETIPTRANNQTIDQNWFNVLKNVIRQNFVPRNASGVATTLAGTLGESTFQWLKAFIASGYWSCGDIKAHHTYNGLVTAGQGWMLCNGDIVNETNYDAIHGSGSWAIYVGTSPIDGKHLPNMTDKYLTGAASTSQDGSVALTFVGNASNQVALASHTHTIPLGIGLDGVSGTKNLYINGAASRVAGGVINNAGGNILFTVSHTNVSADTRAYNGALDTTTNAFGGATQNIRPHSLAVQYWMRII